MFREDEHLQNLAKQLRFKAHADLKRTLCVCECVCVCVYVFVCAWEISLFKVDSMFFLTLSRMLVCATQD